MEKGYEYDSQYELPPLPQEFDPMEYYRNYPSVNTPHESLPPFPSSDFNPSGYIPFSDHKDLLQLQQLGSESFLDSSLSLPDSFFLNTLDQHRLAESTRLEQLFLENNVASQFLHSPDLNDLASQFLHSPDLSDVATPFLHLPYLKSFEQTTTTATAVEETKKPSLSLAPTIAKRRKKLGSSSSSTASGSPTASSSHTIDCIATKRKKISDKIRSLEKLMPWERKMNLAMILEESHRYIRYLQSQVASLLWMPLESVYNSAGEVGETDPLKSLTRQQILQVLANSPGSRNVLSARGYCVFSYEQLLSLKTMSRSL